MNEILSRLSCFTPGEGARGTHWIGVDVGPRAGSGAVGNKVTLSSDGNRTSIAQYSHYSD
jgi:hypothetical protein